MGKRMHGVGVTVVNFLSEWCEVDVSRDGFIYHQEYERGIPCGPVEKVGKQEPCGVTNYISNVSSVFGLSKSARALT